MSEEYEAQEEPAGEASEGQEISGSDTPRFVVGIGASAGGLDPLRTLANRLPENSGAAFVVVQHMASHHKSLLTALIARETPITVETIVTGQVPLPDHIYVAPPDNDVVVTNGRLVLRKPEIDRPGPRPSVNVLFKSLAEEYGPRSVGIIFSGTGSDGAEGIEAIRKAGGITMAQDRESAQYFGMPDAALQTGCVDLVLPPEEIGARIGQIFEMPKRGEDDSSFTTDGADVSDLFIALYRRHRVNFAEYKPSTVGRRIERRMAALGISDTDSYVRLASSSASELDALFQDLLISVTEFFRDPTDFNMLRAEVEKIVERRRGENIRVWVPGCATGEEAYSIAMLIVEALQRDPGGPHTMVEIFATDIDENALAHARKGHYPISALAKMPKELIERHFDIQGKTASVSRNVRDGIIFSSHNLGEDPPFLNIDLVSCRNTLIYFNPTLQKRVLRRLHYALRKTGLLFVGTSEAVSGMDDLFQPVDKGSRLFRRVASYERRADLLTNSAYRNDITRRPHRTAKATSEQEDLLLFDALARTVGPCSLLVSKDMQVRRAYGNVTPFVTLAEGEIKTSVSSLVRPELRLDVRALINHALTTGVTHDGPVHKDTERPNRRVQARVYPITARPPHDDMALVSFREWEEADDSAVIPAEILAEEEPGTRTVALERELTILRDSLEVTVEELETSNQELQSLNEELQSTNEELQSTNEELEASNEELRSTNEELSTVNEEMRTNATELEITNRFLDGVTSSIPSPLVVVDNRRRVQRFNGAAEDLFGLSPNERHAPIEAINTPNGFPDIRSIVAGVLAERTTVLKEIESGRRTWILNASPVRDRRGELYGAILLLTENTEFQSTKRDLELLFDAVPVSMLHKAADGTILRANRAAGEIFGWNPDEMVGRKLADISPELAERDSAIDAAVARTGAAQRNLQRTFVNAHGERRSINVDTVFAPPGPGRPAGVFSVGHDVTEALAAERELSEKNRLIEMAQEVAQLGYWRYEPATNRYIWSERIYSILGLSRDDYTPDLDSAIACFHPDDQAKARAAFSRAIEDKQPFDFNLRIVRPNGEERRVASRGLVETRDDGTVSALFGIFSDITDSPLERELRQAEELKRTADDLRRSNEDLERFSFICSHDLKEPVRTISSLADLLTHPDSDIETEEREDLLSRIKKNTDRMSGIIEALLTYSRVNVKVEIETVDVGQVVADVLEDLSSAIADAKAEIDCGEMPTIHVSPVHIRQLMQNLVSNALKFTPAPVQMRIRAEAQGNTWTFSIEDNGPGIPTDSQISVFSIFKRLHRADEVQGSGLGLSICSKIVSHYMGRIWYEPSTLGGSAFRFSLPGTRIGT